MYTHKMAFWDSLNGIVQADTGVGRKTEEPQRVTAFLSCSVRSHDLSLVNALDEKVFRPLGFDCRTIGRNVSRAEQVDDAVKAVLAECDCLIGVATERFEAVDHDFPTQMLRFTTPYLLQEASMAFQAGLPSLIFKTPGLVLQGVTNRNLWLEVERDLSPKGTPRFKSPRELVLSALDDLKKKASQRRKDRDDAILKANIATGAKWVVGSASVLWAASRLTRPDCFGNYYYKNPACKGCSYKPDCKAEKNRT